MAPQRDAVGLEAIERVMKKPPHELLLQLGGALAILLGLVAFGLQWAQVAPNRQAGLGVTLVVDLILGVVLLVSAAVSRKNVLNGAILGGAGSIVLMLYGGQAGLVGGALGIIGAIVAIAGPYLPRLQRA